MRMVTSEETCPLPDDPTLAAIARALNDADYWAMIVDRNWLCAYMTDAWRLSRGGLRGLAAFPVGAFLNGPEYVTMWLEGPRPFPLEALREAFAKVSGPWMLAELPGGRDELPERVDPRMRDIVDDLAPREREQAATRLGRYIYAGGGGQVQTSNTFMSLYDRTGRLVGGLALSKPAASMAVLGVISAGVDLGHFERMQQTAQPGRRSAAVLFADLESSSALARRLSTASYFALGRRMVRAVDGCVIDTGGLVGRHAGDGVVAFFLAETAGSESAAARACIEAARAIADTISEVAARSELAPEDLVMRFGLHWGANLYVGQIATRGRAEVTALGDEVNECARIEECATGGRAFASKDLMERLEAEDADALDIDPRHLIYTPLAQLPTASEKARRDAPAIAICEI